MCGRYSQAAKLAELARRFGIKHPEELPYPVNYESALTAEHPSLELLNDEIRLLPRYNIAPSEIALTVVREGNNKLFEFMKWGVTRQWDKARKPYFITNLTVEKLTNGAFKSVLSKRRCLIPADGFYEWKEEEQPPMPKSALIPMELDKKQIQKRRKRNPKQPYRFMMKDDGLFAFPAIYDEPVPGSPVRTFTIFTTVPNRLVAPVHHRMPAIMPTNLEDAWLDEGLTDIQKIVDILKPFPASEMKSWAVSTAINSGKVEGPELVNPI